MPAAKLYFLVGICVIIFQNKIVAADVKKKGVSQHMCRDRFGLLSQLNYRRRSCVLCYTYLFPKGTEWIPNVTDFESLVPKRSNKSHYHGPTVSPDSRDEASLQRICKTLEKDQCHRWRSCCQAATGCCQHQVTKPRLRSEFVTHCPRTWDGFSCWSDARAGQTLSAQCPSFLDYAVSQRFALKTCTINATWFTKEGMAWTDYRPCLDRKGYIDTTFLSLGCSFASIAVLVPSIAIFIYFKELLSQDRIRVHINLFVSLVMCGIVSILWDFLVRYDKITNPVARDTLMFRNTAGCKLVSGLKIYFHSTSYFWMFCEGFYLHRLIIKAFEPPNNLSHLYAIGWGVPILHTVAYCIVRTTLANKNCWAYNFGRYEWIIYGPNLACLTVNLFFLCNILRILIFQLHSHPHEYNSFRRGLKAAFMLTPLFGLQLFLTVYRLPMGELGQRVYEMLTIIVVNSQGIFVSVIFCYLNSEVIGKLKNTSPCCKKIGRHRRPHKSASTASIQYHARDVSSLAEPLTLSCNSNNKSLNQNGKTVKVVDEKEVHFLLPDISVTH